jgi:selenocysteine lyase/cysteine desulfurase
MDRFGVSGMVRPSFAFYNTFDEIDRLIDALYELCGAGAL